jgi:Domain of unknown function (DUF4078)
VRPGRTRDAMRGGRVGRGSTFLHLRRLVLLVSGMCWSRGQLQLADYSNEDLSGRGHFGRGELSEDSASGRDGLSGHQGFLNQTFSSPSLSEVRSSGTLGNPALCCFNIGRALPAALSMWGERLSGYEPHYSAGTTPLNHPTPHPPDASTINCRRQFLRQTTMSSKGLYGEKKKRKLQGKEIDSSTSLSFASQLSSLIASSTTTKDGASKTAPGRPRPKKGDIFSSHNTNVKKRALKDPDHVDVSQDHSTSSEPLDDATWHRNKRRMEEKARLYAAMKRGDVEDVDDKYGVDFDRKWAEAQERGEDYNDTSSGEDDAGSDSDQELVEYIDEFGRTIKGTKREAAREARKIELQNEDASKFSARPEMPETVIYGDAVQAEAFNPEEDRWRKMQELAAKRDKEPTPPPDAHYNAKQEVRTRGTGFFQFSADEEERKKQMENLEKERIETEKIRAEAKSKRDERRREIEERRKMLKEKRTKVQANRFLNELMGEMEASKTASADHEGG